MLLLIIFEYVFLYSVEKRQVHIILIYLLQLFKCLKKLIISSNVLLATIFSTNKLLSYKLIRGRYFIQSVILTKLKLPAISGWPRKHVLQCLALLYTIFHCTDFTILHCTTLHRSALLFLYCILHYFTLLYFTINHLNISLYFTLPNCTLMYLLYDTVFYFI